MKRVQHRVQRRLLACKQSSARALLPVLCLLVSGLLAEGAPANTAVGSAAPALLSGTASSNSRGSEAPTALGRSFRAGLVAQLKVGIQQISKGHWSRGRRPQREERDLRILTMHTITIARKDGTPDSGFDAELRIDGGDPYEVTITNPFRKKQEDDLELYFEDWQRFPFTNTTVAERAAQSIRDYGIHLFNETFACKESQDEYAQLLDNLGNVMIEIVSQSPDFHALHWEALWDPGQSRPLSVDCSIVRRLQEQVPPPTPIEASPILNLLVVVARPDGEWDVGYRTISRPVVEAVKAGKLRVNVELLRPGTFEALSEQLAAKGRGYYHMVHFDCHGALLTFDQAKQALNDEPHCRKRLRPYAGVKAFLMLEGIGGANVDLVRAPELARLLIKASIPICILNACQSGKQVLPTIGPVVDSALSQVPSCETSLGSCLLSKGLQIVVAMAYTVTVTAAQVMMKELYSQLCARRPVLQSLQLGRLQLHNNKRRRAYHNETIELEDWLLPVVYANQGVDLNLRDFKDDEERERYPASVDSVCCLRPPKYGFVGRDLDILKIETALLHHSALLLRGMGGTGKTTLLRYLCEWWQITRFATSVFYFGYDERAWTLQQILLGIVQQICDKPRQRRLQAMDDAALAEEVVGRLKDTGCVLILDNLESITSQELAIMNTLPPDERAKVSSFLGRLVNAQTRVVLGSRGGEDWLAEVICQNVHHLQGLDPESRSMLAQKILKRAVSDECRVAELNKNDDFHRLLDILEGYPLAMEVVLANLKQQTPKEILAGLDEADVHLDIPSNNKDNSILRCVDYSFRALCPETQPLLVCLVYFKSVVVLANLHQYIELLQACDPLWHINFARFDEAIQDAVKWGLLSPHDLSGNGGDDLGVLNVHPVLPFFLKTKLNELDVEQQQMLRTCFKWVFRSIANGCRQQMGSMDGKERNFGLRLCELECENLSTALMMFIEDMETTEISECLIQYLEVKGDYQSGLKLAKLVVKAQGNYPPEHRIDAADAISALSHLGHMYRNLLNLEKAKEAYHGALRVLQCTNDDGTNYDIRHHYMIIYHHLGTVASLLRDYVAGREYHQQALDISKEYDDYHFQADNYYQIGRVAEDLGDFVEARRNYQNALDIYIQYGDRFNQANTYQQLGIAAECLGDYVGARHLHQQALGIRISMGDARGQARSYHHLGLVATELRDFVEACQNYQRALDIEIEFDDRHSQAGTYHQMGILAAERGDYVEAHQNYQRALDIEIELDDRRWQADTYHQMGITAAEQGNFVEARQNYQRALDIKIELDDRHSQASAHHQMGTLAVQLGDFVEARQSYQRALDIHIEFDDRHSQAGTYHQMGMVAAELGDFVEARQSYQRALDIEIEFDDRHTQASTHHQMGMLAAQLCDFVEARQHYQRALDICIAFDDRFSQASTYYQMGMMAAELGDFVEARQHYQRALDIEIEFDDRTAQFKTYHQMGENAKMDGDLVEARESFQRALDIEIECGDFQAQVKTYLSLSRLYVEQGMLDIAKENLNKGLALSIEMQNEHKVIMISELLDRLDSI